MADNTTLFPGSGGDIIATDDIGGVKYQRIKLTHGIDGVTTGDVSNTNPFPVYCPSFTPIDISATLAVANTAQNTANANPTRKGWWIQNKSTLPIWVSDLTTANMVSVSSIKIESGFLYETPQGCCNTGRISVIGTNTKQSWAGREW